VNSALSQKRFYFLFFFILILVISVSNCSKAKLKSNATLKERMQHGLKLYENGDYFNAKTQFRVITLSNSGSLMADSAQFYYAECHFHLKEFIIAASEYNRLMTVYPGSQFVDDAKYKIGLSYYELSPKYHLDQEYTYEAIRHFQEFLEDYYNADPELTKKVEGMLKKARNKLANKVYASAEIYRKMGFYKSANLYFNKVMEEYYDTEFAIKALYWIGECNRKMEEYQAALSAFDQFLQKYPDHEWIVRVRSKIKQTQKDYAKHLETVAKQKDDA